MHQLTLYLLLFLVALLPITSIARPSAHPDTLSRIDRAHAYRARLADDPPELPDNYWDPVVQSLDGSDWVLENANRSIRITNATLPGSVWTQLLTDPLQGYNERDYQWIAAERYWHYSKVWETNQSLWYDFVSFNYEIVLDGVDCVAEAWLNGQYVGRMNNVHRRYTFPAPLWDNSQYNRIDLYLYSPAAYANTQAAAYPYPVPTIDPDAVNSNRSFIRKPTSDFGWDFAPHYQSVGVRRGVYVRSFNQAWVSDVVVRQWWGVDMDWAEQNRWGVDSGDVLLNVTAYLRTNTQYNTSGVLSVQILDQYVSQPVAFPAAPQGNGDFLYPVSIYVAITKSPLWSLWWPYTLGASPLYNLTVTFNGTTTGNERLHSLTKRVGFRNIRLIRQPTPNSDGLSFQFTVNGQRLFAKGANLTPLDAFEHRVGSGNVSDVLQSVVDANMNMLRVWGGGVYQSEAVYDWCDEHGLLVWQEVTFACAMAPADQAFLDNVREEVSQQVRRLASHPSLAILGGNNENEEALSWFDPTKSNPTLYLIDYNNLYTNTIRDAILREIATDIEYVTSSPSNGPLSTTPLYTQRWGNPNDPHYGDVHYYPDPATADLADEGTWPRARFVSETGFPSFASRWTMLAGAGGGGGNDSLVVVNGTWLEWRQRYGLNNWVTEVNQLEIAKHFRLPSTTNATLYYDTFTYLSQANQALIYSTAIQAMRRQMSEPPSYTSGILFWQLNDIWQTPSYAAIEYGSGGRWKMVMYEARRQYQRVIVSGYVYPRASGDNATVGVYVVNDGPFVGVKGSVEVQLRVWSTGRVVRQWDVEYSQEWYSASQVWSSTLGELLHDGEYAASECFVYLNASVSNGSAQWWVTHVVYLTQLRDANLQPVPMGVAVFGEEEKVTVESTIAIADDTYAAASLFSATTTPASSPSLSHSPSSTRHLYTLSPTSASLAPTSPTPLPPLARQRILGLSVSAAAVSPFTFFEVPWAGRWSDNGLLLLPNVSVGLTWTAWGGDGAEVQVSEFMKALRIRTLWYSYNEK